MIVYRSFFFLFTFTLLIFPLLADAGWQVSRPNSSIPREPFFQAGIPPKMNLIPSAYSSAVLPNQYARLGQPAARYAVSVSGSLKDNVERIMGRYHWKVIWKAPYDFNFDGRVCGSNLQTVLEKLLEPFPLQAQMYMSNRIVTIVARDKYDKEKA